MSLNNIIALLVLVCISGSALSLRHLEAADHTSAYAAGQTQGQTYGGVVKATQYSSSEALNVIKEEVATMCKAIHILMPVKGQSKKDTCYRVYHAILPNVKAMSKALAGAFSTSVSTAYSTGGGVACAGGAAKSQAIQCVEVLKYALYSTSWTQSDIDIDSVLDSMKPDFVAAFSGAHSLACTQYGYASAYQTSLAEAVSKELHVLFPLLHYGYPCDGEYSVEERDSSNAVTKGETSLSGYSQGSSGGIAYSTQGDGVHEDIFKNFLSYDH